MRRVRLTLGYRGTHYAGWGVQPSRPTVQGAVESALASALGHSVRVTAAGRTDAGVHADAQVVSFATSSTITPHGLQRVLATTLPSDVWVVDAAEAPEEFDARRSAKRRWYRYTLKGSEGLDVRAMRDAAETLIGRHDFASFATQHTGTTERTVFAADWRQIAPDRLVFEICADAFLKHMVRGIVGSLLWVGARRWQPDTFAAALDAKDRRAAGPNAPADGLTLQRIEY